MEGDRDSLADSTGGNVSDVAISSPDLPEKRLTSADDEEEKEGGNVSDDLHPEIEAPLLEYSDIQRMLASTTLSRMQQDLILKTFLAKNDGSEVDRMKKVPEDAKNDLDDRATHFEGQIADLKKVQESRSTYFLKKETELKLIVEELNFKLDKERVAHRKKKEEINTLTEALNKRKEELAFEKEKTNYSIAIEKKKVTSLEEILLVVKDECKELEEEILKARLALETKEEVIFSIAKELRIKREKDRDISEIENKLIAIMEEKRSRIVSLKKDLMLANERHECRNNKLEEELKQLKYHNSKLEEMTKKTLFGDEDGGFLQNNRGVEPKESENELKFSWVTTTALMTSTGTAAAAITALCLRHKKQG